MKKMLDFYGLQADTITAADIAAIVRQWQEAVVGLDKMVYEDAKKEFSLTSRPDSGQMEAARKRCATLKKYVVCSKAIRL